MKGDVIYDIEVYPNFFSAILYGVDRGVYKTFEVSERKNDFVEFAETIIGLGNKRRRMVGFNNFSYDYPVVHRLLTSYIHKLDSSWQDITKIAFEKSKSIINAPHNDRFSHIIWDRDQHVRQVDLFKIHHFDNIARSTSLKVLQFNMRSDSIEELPLDPTQPVSTADIDLLLEYCKHDVDETYKFYLETLDAIRFREELNKKFGKNFLNANDTKIGKTIFQLELEKHLGKDICFTIENDKRKPRQTWRKEIVVKDIIFDCVAFERPEFNAVLDWMNRQTFSGTQTKGVFTGLHPDSMGSLAEYADLTTKKSAEWGPEPRIKTLNTIVDGFEFVFGTGGLHGCVDPCIIESDDEHVIIDLDVVSYYPSLAISNQVFPKHLGKQFCSIYEKLKKQRMTHAKGTPENAALKLALNGVYGDSNNQYSPFYDPQYTMSITINGQLLLCMLSEQLMEIEGLQMIQANTDGVTVRLPRSKEEELASVCSRWEQDTDLELESAVYSRMFIRDVNSYIAEYEDGSLKRKGAYEYKLEWHKNHSALVVQRAVEAHLVDGIDLDDFIRGWAEVDPRDFYLRTKVPRSSRLELRWEHAASEPLQNICRYYVSDNGNAGHLMKIMPPLKKNPDKWREISVMKGYTVIVHDKIAPLHNIDFNYYKTEALKLIDPLTQTK